MRTVYVSKTIDSVNWCAAITHIVLNGKLREFTCLLHARIQLPFAVHSLYLYIFELSISVQLPVDPSSGLEIMGKKTARAPSAPSHRCTSKTKPEAAGVQVKSFSLKGSKIQDKNKAKEDEKKKKNKTKALAEQASRNARAKTPKGESRSSSTAKADAAPTRPSALRRPKDPKELKSAKRDLTKELEKAATEGGGKKSLSSIRSKLEELKAMEEAASEGTDSDSDVSLTEQLNGILGKSGPEAPDDDDDSDKDSASQDEDEDDEDQEEDSDEQPEEDDEGDEESSGGSEEEEEGEEEEEEEVKENKLNKRSEVVRSSSSKGTNEKKDQKKKKPAKTNEEGKGKKNKDVKDETPETSLALVAKETDVCTDMVRNSSLNDLALNLSQLVLGLISHP